MIEYPSSMKTGMALALIAGILCFVAMVTEFDQNNPDVLRHMGVYLLVAVVTFAIAGGFSKYAQWTRPVLGGMIFTVAGIAIAFYLLRHVPLWFLIGEIILCATMMTTLSSVQLKGYLNRPTE